MDTDADTPPADTPPATTRRDRPSPSRSLWVGAVAAAVALALAVAAVAAFSALGDDSSEPALRLTPEDPGPPPPAPDPTGEALPERSFPLLAGGEGSFADYRGRPLVINFFASWCAPCVAEMPGFEEVHRQLGDQVAVLGMNLQEPVGDATALVRRTGVTYEIGRDETGELFQALGGTVMPTTVFVTAEGRIADVHGGALSVDDLGDRVRELVG
ncbi:MAG: TlpA family protein disulfide reductase [Acidimicrobiales bacterium]